MNHKRTYRLYCSRFQGAHVPAEAIGRRHIGWAGPWLGRGERSRVPGVLYPTGSNTLFSASAATAEPIFSATPSAQVPAAPRWLRAAGPSPLAAAASAFAIAPMASSCSAEPVLSCLITLRSSSGALSTTHYSVGGEKTLNTGMPGAGPYSAPINTPPSRPKPASWCSPGSTTIACSSPPRTSRPNEAASGAPALRDVAAEVGVTYLSALEQHRG